jgi:dihydroflavonol-4-reductase
MAEDTASLASLKGKRYLVTGGTGFLGWHLIPVLDKAGATIRLFARNPSRELAQMNSERVKRGESQIEFYKGSILDKNALRDAMKDCSGVFHLAGLVVHSRQSPQVVFDTNVTGTMNVLKASKIYPGLKVVYASTSGTVAISKNQNETASDSSSYATQYTKHWPYYQSKVEAEEKALEYARKNKISLVVLRPSMMLGPEDFYLRATKTVRSFIDRHIPFVPSGGASFLDVRDAACAFATAMTESGKSGETYLLTAHNCSLLEFFNMLQSVSGVRRPALQFPPWLAIGAATALDAFNRKIKKKWDPGVDPVKAEMASHWWNVDASKAEQDLHFKPRPPLDTLRDTVEWLRSAPSSPSTPNPVWQSKL